MSSVRLKSTAPHVYDASTIDSELSDWGPQPNPIKGSSHSTGLLLFKDPDVPIEVGLWRCTPGRWSLTIPHDELCYFSGGRATYRSVFGKELEIGPDSLVHFPAGWSGEAEVHEKLFNTYMLCPGSSGDEVPVFREASKTEPVSDWGLIPTMIEGSSRTGGNLLRKTPGGRAESGLWNCTPGRWFCHVTSHEYCHFLAGRCTYVHEETGESIEILPDTLAFFPQGWKGVCTVHEPIRKAYMIA